MLILKKGKSSDYVGSSQDQGPRSILQIEGTKTFQGAKHAENQEQGDF